MATTEAKALIRRAAEVRLEAAMVKIGKMLGVERPKLDIRVSSDPVLNQARQMESIALWAEQVAAVVTNEAKEGAIHG